MHPKPLTQEVCSTTPQEHAEGRAQQGGKEGPPVVVAAIPSPVGSGRKTSRDILGVPVNSDAGGGNTEDACGEADNETCTGDAREGWQDMSV